MKLFAELISPVSVPFFFEFYWTKSELYLSNGFNIKKLFSMDKLNELLNTNQDHLSFPVIRLIKNGKVISETRYTELVTKRRQATSRKISMESIIDFCNNGATFTFNGLDNYSSELAEYCSGLTDELNEATQINCYLTQKEEQGLDPHYDHQEIFIIQVQGEKTWELFGMADKFPLPTNKYYEQGEPNYSERRSYTLGVGDVLYIPRGMWHQAKTENKTSLHLTLNIVCNLKVDFLHWLIEHGANQSEKLRENLFVFPNTPNANLISFAEDFFKELAISETELVGQFVEDQKKRKRKELPFKI